MELKNTVWRYLGRITTSLILQGIQTALCSEATAIGGDLFGSAVSALNRNSALEGFCIIHVRLCMSSTWACLSAISNLWHSGNVIN